MDLLFSWLAYFPAFLGALALFYVPGLLLAFSIKLRGFTSLVVAPAFSAVSLTIAAVLFNVVGIEWTWWSNFVISVLLSSIIWVVAKLILKKNHNIEGKKPETASSLFKMNKVFKNYTFTSVSAWLIAAFLAGFISVSYFLLKSIGNPQHPIMRWDSIFHQDAIQYIIQTGSASPMTLLQVLNPTSFKFYPAVFHGFVSEVILLCNVSVPVAYNMVTLVFCAVIWVSSMLYLLYTLFPKQKPVWVVGSIITAGFPTYPYYQLGTSGVIPNIVAYAFIPSALALIFQIVRPTKNSNLNLTQKFISLFILTIGASLTHPSAAFSIFIVSIGLVGEYLVTLYATATSGKNKKITLLCITLFVLAIVLAWYMLSIPFQRNQSSLSFTEALWKGITSNFLTQDFWQPLLAILTLLGFILATIIKKWRFVAIGYAATLLLYLMTVSFPNSALRDIVTGIWYNSASRIITLFVPLAVILICILLSELLTKFPKKSYFISIIAIFIAAFATFTPAMNKLTGYIYTHAYQVADTQPLMNMDKYLLLQNFKETVPQNDGVIANNPYNGGQFAYILTGHPVLFPYQGTEFKSNEQKIIAQKLNQAATDPEVCQAIKKENIKYALDFGQNYMKNELSYYPSVPSGTDYPGLTNLQNTPGFQQIAQYGTATLYKVTACQT